MIQINAMKQPSKAFTLIELVFVMVILGLLGGVAIPRIANIVGLSNKTHAFKMAGFLQRAHQMAMLRHKNVRIVIDMDQKQFWVEEEMPPALKPLLPEEFKVDDVLMEFRKEAENYDSDEEVEKRKLARFQKLSEKGFEPAKMPSPLTIESVYFSTTQTRVNEGLIFIPIAHSGYHPTTIVYLAHQNEIIFSIVFPSLSSKAQILKGEVSIDEIQW